MRAVFLDGKDIFLSPLESTDDMISGICMLDKRSKNDVLYGKW